MIRKGMGRELRLVIEIPILFWGEEGEVRLLETDREEKRLARGVIRCREGVEELKALAEDRSIRKTRLRRID